MAAVQHATDSEVEEVVPVSSWAKQGVTPHVPRSASQTHLIQYGPLTAQGNFLSDMDSQHLDWQPRAPTNAAVMPAALFFQDAPALTAGPFGSLSTSHAASLHPWSDMNGPYSESAYRIYEQPPLIVPSGYPSMHTDGEFYGNMSSAPLTDFVSAPSMERTTLGPWEGIWAFNPNNVAENFVYPSTDDATTPLAGAPFQSFPSPPDRAGLSASASVADEGAVSPLNGAGIAHQSNQMMLSSRSPASSDLEPHHSPRQRNSPSGASLHVSGRNQSDSSQNPKSLKPEKVKRNKTMQVQLLVPRRQGPLSVEQRQKADDMRYYGACWRCRRYKKPCNGPGECDTCKTSGFRVWPSTIGCYRGNMEDFISGVMPGNAEVIMRELGEFSKKPNWKVHFGYQPDLAPLPLLTGREDRFSKLSVKLQATRMAGPGFIELVDILANFQQSRTKPDMCLEHVCEALSYICDVYHAFVATDTTIKLPPSDLLTALTKFRSHYSANWRHFLALCLSGRRNAWFPAFLCATVNVPLLVVLKDGFVAIPEPARSRLWPNISFLIEDLRNRLYPMGLDLLSALAKGIKPWKLRCWGMVPCRDPKTKQPIPGRYERNPDGLRLLSGDVGAFDGFAAVQAWLARNREAMHHGVSFLTTPPFSERNAKMQPIAALAWIFDVAPPGKKVVNGQVVDGLDEDAELAT